MQSSTHRLNDRSFVLTYLLTYLHVHASTETVRVSGVRLQGRSSHILIGPAKSLPSPPLPSPPFPPLPSLPRPPIPSLLSLSLPLEVGPLFAAGRSGGALKLPQRVQAEPGRQTHSVAF